MNDEVRSLSHAKRIGVAIGLVETDADGAVYEAHMTKSDGSRVTVKFDKDLNVTAIQDGMRSRN